MEEWKVISKEEFDLDEEGNFIEVSLKEHPISKELLYGISKGWKNKEGFKKYKSNIIISKENKDKLVKLLSKIE
ncbi:MAG: hypothetical protein LAT82_01140 [Nanoarchaeota archaeon]|nr:hypothetical protein [Nanoarchaeota archaeon]